MQLGWPWGRKQREPALDTVPLKKIVAVSDEYWGALYSPITDSVARSLGVFEKQRAKLYSDYVDQFVRLVRRSKGTVQDDPLIVHLHTFSLCVAFSSLYVARLCHSFEFTAISKAKKNKGDRSNFYPWISVPSECEIKLSKFSRLYPAYIHALSIFNTMMNDIGWKWLHSKPEILKGLLDSIYTNGEKGQFSGILADMRNAPLGRQVEQAVQAAGSKSVFEDNEAQALEQNGSLDDLINGLGGGGEDVSLDDLLEASKQDTNKGPSETVESSQKGEVESKEESNGPPAVSELEELSAGEPPLNSENPAPKLEESENPAPKFEKTTAPERVSSADALNEFTEFLASATSAKVDETEQAPEVDEKNESTDTSEPSPMPESPKNEENTDLLFSSESSITADLLKWCLAQVKDVPSNSGVHVLTHNNSKVIVVEGEEGVMEFVRSDYDLDSEAAYKTVAEEVLTDLAMSQSWIENEDGGDIWEISLQGENVNVLLLNIPVPPTYEALDSKSYKWVVKNAEPT